MTEAISSIVRMTASYGFAAFTIGRPTTIRSAPALMAFAGVIIRSGFWSSPGTIAHVGRILVVQVGVAGDAESTAGRGPEFDARGCPEAGGHAARLLRAAANEYILRPF